MDTPRRELNVETDDVETDHGRTLFELVDANFASTCQAVRTNKEQCPFGCAKLLAPRTIDYHRLNGCRGRQDDAFADVSRKRSFTCGACYEEFVTREAFFAHLNSDHAVEAVVREQAFPDYRTFERFRYWLEAQGGAHFRQKSGAKHRASGKGVFMMCNRSGLVHTSAATGEQDRDKLGSYRMGYTCTAFINGTVYPDGHVSIRYCGDHYGHDARVRLPQSVKNIIMHMQMTGRPNTMIIRYLQDHFIPFGHTSIHAQRAAYVDLEELRSITPMLRRLPTIPFDKEEEWEQEFLDTAGIVRDWAPPPVQRDADWLPIRDYAEKMRWIPPLVFKAKIRNANGEWMVLDEERQVFVLDENTERTRNKLHSVFLDDLGELEEQYEPTSPLPAKGMKKRPRETRGAGTGEAAAEAAARNGDAAVAVAVEEEDVQDEEVDVEELREEDKEERAGPSTSSVRAASASSTPAGKKRRRLEEAKEEGKGREEEDDDEEGECIEAASSNGLRSGCGYLASAIVAELEMIKVLVKTESEFLSEAELRSFLRQTRSLRLSFEPLSRGPKSGVMGQREFAVPQLSRQSRAYPMRHLRAPRGFVRRSEPGARWGASSETDLEQQQQHQKPSPRPQRGGSRIGHVVDSHEMDVCDEEVVVGTGNIAAKLQYNSRLWS